MSDQPSRAVALAQPHADLPSASEFEYVPLSQGKVAIIDATDYPRISGFKWHAIRDPKNGRYYAVRNVRRDGGGRTVERMHRRIVNAPDNLDVDHENGDGLDNRRFNLRHATCSQNLTNRTSLNRNNKSGYRGVARFQRSNKWTARAGLNGRLVHLGLFSDPMEAARAYDAFVITHHGEFASPNFPHERRVSA